MQIEARTRGQGPVLILLHGFAGSVLHWEQMVSKLEPEMTCVLLNYSQFYLGRAAMPFSQQVDQIGEWIQKNYPRQRVHLAGMSFGGALAWAITLKYSHLVERCVFINPMPVNPTESFAMKSMRFFFTISLGRTAVFLFLETGLGQQFLTKCAQIFRLRSQKEASRLTSLQGRKKMLLGHLFNNFAWILRQEDWGEWMQRFELWRHPSLMIFDDQDPLFAPQTYQKMTELLKCEETVVLSGAGHIATALHSDLIAEEVLRFLKQERYQKAG